ncbi:MAG: PIG-L family deacetylase [Candidatus Cloacimonetes bacterium]|nr:PIG-L family deacetylase [Candidatus Cloacimonadota bacterium]
MVNDKYSTAPQRVLFVSIHPDDETFGCGGTILWHKNNGDAIYWLNLTGPTPNHPYGFTNDVINKRENQLSLINQAYGFKQFINLPFPTQMLETVEQRILVGSISKAYADIKPDVLYLPNRSDIHSDHRAGFAALFAAAKSFRSPYIKKILMYETLSETEFAPALSENAFIPNSWVDISVWFERKLEIINIYDTEVMPDPYPRSIHAVKGLGAFRGSRICVSYAEAFVQIFETR